MSGDTAPFVRHLLFRTAAEAMMSGRPLHQLSVGLWSSETKDSSDDDVRSILKNRNCDRLCYQCYNCCILNNKNNFEKIFNNLDRCSR